MNDWNTLPIKERAAFIKIGVANGLRDIGSIREQYNKFQDGGLKDGHILELPRDSYEIWKSSLPSNLRNTDESLYNLREAYESGANPIYNSYDGLYHLNTRDPKTGEILKQPAHPTYILGLLEDIKMGYYPYTKDGKTYTGTWRGNENYLNTINKFQGGGLIDSTKLAFSGLDADMPKRDMDVNYEWRYTLPKVTTGAHNKAYSGNLFEEGGPTDSWKPWYWFTPSYDSQPSLKDAIMQAYKDGRKGNNILYKGRAYKALLNEQEDKEFTIANQHELNRNITNEQVVDTYIDNVLLTMENPNNEGLKDGLYYPYTDVDAKGITHYNIGPGIEKNSDIAKNNSLDYSGKTGYTLEYLREIIRPDLLKKMENINLDLHDMYKEDADTMSLGNRTLLLDTAHNVAPRGEKRKNMPKAWPNLTDAMMTGDTEKAKKNTYSGSSRRSKMRNDLLWQNEINSTTVKNR